MRSYDGSSQNAHTSDPATVADEATYEEPTRTARGIEHVMLGGEFAVEHRRPSRLDLGQVLRAHKALDRQAA